MSQKDINEEILDNIKKEGKKKKRKKKKKQNILQNNNILIFNILNFICIIKLI